MKKIVLAKDANGFWEVYRNILNDLNYQVEVIGYDSGEYDLDVVMLNYLGDSSEEKYSGNAADGSSDVVEFTYNPGSLVFIPMALK